MNKQVVTRFAPSPTGKLHIGGARTALFNWLYARASGGKFLLRIEDTDLSRSTPEATIGIINDLKWLGLDHDDDIVSQVSRADRHREVADQLLAAGKAYKCFATQDEVNAAREADTGKGFIFRSPWRDADVSTHPDAPYVVRIRAPRDGETVIHDEVRGDVIFKNSRLDDMVLLRSDGSPTYMLSVVVDDHDMGVTHVIRGDDHTNNAARQVMVYDAMGWDVPVWAHIPLILGPDGKKLSKRLGAAGLEEYKKLGYRPQAVRNYLARLGWSHGDDEIMTDTQLRRWFDFRGINKAPARLDPKQMAHVNSRHMAMIGERDKRDVMGEICVARRLNGLPALSAAELGALDTLMPDLANTSRDLNDFVDSAHFFLIEEVTEFDPKALKALQKDGAVDILKSLLSDEGRQYVWKFYEQHEIQRNLENFVETNGLKFAQVGAPLRAALTGRTKSPSVSEMIDNLGGESIARVEKAIRMVKELEAIAENPDSRAISV